MHILPLVNAINGQYNALYVIFRRIWEAGVRPAARKTFLPPGSRAKIGTECAISRECGIRIRKHFYPETREVVSGIANESRADSSRPFATNRAEIST